MKREMRRRFVPAYYTRELHLRLKCLIQGDRTVDEYYQEMEMCLLRTMINEDEESKMARFLVGLNKQTFRFLPPASVSFTRASPTAVVDMLLLLYGRYQSVGVLACTAMASLRTCS